MKRIAAGLIALGMAGVVVGFAHAEALAICAIYTPNDVHWYLFLCYLAA